MVESETAVNQYRSKDYTAHGKNRYSEIYPSNRNTYYNPPDKNYYQPGVYTPDQANLQNSDYFTPPGANDYGSHEMLDTEESHISPGSPQWSHEPQIPPYPHPREEIEKIDVLDHFGLFPEIPTLIALKISSLVLLIILVELNTIVNLATLHPSLEAVLGTSVNSLIGISLVGLLLGILFRYLDLEYNQLKLIPIENRNSRFKSYLTLLFLVAIGIFIVIEVVVELFSARGFLALIDIIIVFTVTFGTYTIFSANRQMIILTIISIFIIMFLGIDRGTDLPILVLLGCLTLLFIELADGAIRLQEYTKRFYEITDEAKADYHLKYQITQHMDMVTTQFLKNLGIYFVLTLLISGILLMLYELSPHITPAFINENIEHQTVYGLMPIILLLLIFYIVYNLMVKYVIPIFQKDILKTK